MVLALVQMAAMDVEAGQLETFTADFEHAQETATVDPAEAIAIYRKIIFSGALLALSALGWAAPHFQ